MQTARSRPSGELIAPVPAANRREMLLDVAAQMIASGDIAGVSMESVAASAGVSRPLVYKHFANREELLRALYRRESIFVNDLLVDKVGSAPSLRDKLHALISVSLGVQSTRGTTFAALASIGFRLDSKLDTRIHGHGRVLEVLTALTVEEIGLEKDLAADALTLALNAIPPALQQFRADPTPGYAERLATIYVTMTIAGLRALVGAQPLPGVRAAPSS